MEKLKHTPGEWKWDGDPSNYDPQEEAPWLLANDNPIVTGEINIINPFDAKLIAVAPDQQKASILLYDLCKTLANIIDYEIFDSVRDEWNKAMNAHEQVIKRATE